MRKYLDLDCPECGQKAAECVDTVMAHQPFTQNAQADIEWEPSKPILETSTAVTDSQGRELIRCPDGHEWFSRIEGVDHDRPKTVSVEVEEDEVGALSALFDKAIEMLEFEGVRDDEEQSAMVNAVDKLQHKLTQALKGAERRQDAEGAHALA